MAELKYKARALKNPMTKAVAWYPVKVTYSNIGERDIIDYAVQNSNIERSVLEQAMIGLEEAINNFLTNGHNIQFWPLGSFFTAIRSKGSNTEKEVTAAKIKSLRIGFVASPQLKAEAQRALVKVRKA